MPELLEAKQGPGTLPCTLLWCPRHGSLLPNPEAFRGAALASRQLSPPQVHLPGLSNLLLNKSLHRLAQILGGIARHWQLPAIALPLQAEEVPQIRVILRHLWAEKGFRC